MGEALRNAERQQRHRYVTARKLSRVAQMESALRLIVAKLEGRDKPLTNEIREIACRGLDGDAA